MNKKKQDTVKNFSVEKFWKDYYKADFFERKSIIQKNLMPIFKKFIDGSILKVKGKELREHIIITDLQAYFDDLVEIVYKLGYERALDECGVLHGKDAERLMKEMKDAEDGKIPAKRRKFLEECAEAFKKLEGNKERLES